MIVLKTVLFEVWSGKIYNFLQMLKSSLIKYGKQQNLVRYSRLIVSSYVV